MATFTAVISDQITDMPINVPVLVKRKGYKTPFVTRRDEDEPDLIAILGVQSPDDDYGVYYKLEEIEWWMGLPQT